MQDEAGGWMAGLWAGAATWGKVQVGCTKRESWVEEVVGAEGWAWEVQELGSGSGK